MGSSYSKDEAFPETTSSTPGSAQTTPSAQVLAVRESHSQESYWLRLEEQLHLLEDGLSSEELTQLKELLHLAEDVFALNDSKLGHTSLVQHRVDTGDHPPVKQLPRRLPFSRRLSSLKR